MLLVSAAAGSLLGGCGSDDGAGAVVRDRVERVVDGDTVELRRAGKVRLIGVDTPETFGSVECWGPEASAWLKRRLARGDRVSYRVGPEPRDKYDRLLIYLRDRRGPVNVALVRTGQARTLSIAPNDDRAASFDSAQRQAAGKRVGLWGKCDGA
jgi:micrococcal nuclease